MEVFDSALPFGVVTVVELVLLTFQPLLVLQVLLNPAVVGLHGVDELVLLLLHGATLVTFVFDGILGTLDVELEKIFFVLALRFLLLLLLFGILSCHLLLLLEQGQLSVPLSCSLDFLYVTELCIESLLLLVALLLELLLFFHLALDGFGFLFLGGFLKSLNVILLFQPILFYFAFHI